MAGEVSVQQKIINLLSDDRPHERKELEDCLWAEDPHYSTVGVQVQAIRNLIRPRGEDVICFRMKGKSWYQHVNKVVSSEEAPCDLT